MSVITSPSSSGAGRHVHLVIRDHRAQRPIRDRRHRCSCRPRTCPSCIRGRAPHLVPPTLASWPRARRATWRNPGELRSPPGRRGPVSWCASVDAPAGLHTLERAPALRERVEAHGAAGHDPALRLGRSLRSHLHRGRDGPLDPASDRSRPWPPRRSSPWLRRHPETLKLGRRSRRFSGMSAPAAGCRPASWRCRRRSAR